jgi:hypothetical protein
MMSSKQPFLTCILELILLAIFFDTASPIFAEESREDACHPKIDMTQSQYIIGYGSLMENNSRLRTTPNAGVGHPIIVKGYQRGWFAQTPATTPFGTTALGVIRDEKGSFNAVVYQTSGAKEVLETDKRETFYCRRSVKSSEFELLKKDLPVPNGQIWIYAIALDSKTIQPPSDRNPIIQSYVDIFLSGCLEQAQNYELKDFADQCIQTTTNWSSNWLNDRIYPRRPFIYQPKAFQIDRLLDKNVPEYFRKIRIE